MNEAIHWTAPQYQGSSGKYRASCDACNEAKVRCSQDKPTCARCQRSQRTCVYGLSRRSHKSAARPGATDPSHQDKQQQQQRRNLEQQYEQHLSSPPRSNTATTTMTTATSTSTATSPAENAGTTTPLTPSGIMSFAGFSDPGLDSGLFSSASSLLDTVLQGQNGGPDFVTGGQDFSDLGLDFPLGNQIVGDVALSAGHADPWDGTTASTTPGGGFSLHDGYAPASSSSSSSSPSPTTIAWFITELASATLPLCAQGCPFDVQLSNLKAAIGFAEECLSPSHTDWDDMMPLMLSTLFCSIIKGFENSLDTLDVAGEGPTNISSDNNIIKGAVSNTTHSKTSSPTRQPLFSWGALCIDDDDELALLKRHMWLVQFRRVDAVLQGLQGRIKGMKHEQMDQATAQKILASNHIHLWLEQRAQLVRHKFLAAAATTTGGDTPLRE